MPDLSNGLLIKKLNSLSPLQSRGILKTGIMGKKLGIRGQNFIC